MKSRLNFWLVILLYIAVSTPFLYLVFAYFTHNLTVNPILTAEEYSGDYAITLLVLSLACTPLNVITGYSIFVRFRRILGLSAFFYAAIHFLLFIGVDYGFDFPQILLTISRKPYIIIGLVVFIILIFLAITSLRRIQKALGRRWKTLQRLVYLASLGAVLHYGLAVKGNLLTLKGNILRPYIYAGVVVILLLLRIPPIERAIAARKGDRLSKKKDLV